IGDRRNHMYEAAQSFFFMPGGLGTLDEILDVVTKEYLKTYRDAEGEYHKPMIFVNEGGYYDNLIAQIEEMIKEKTVNPEIWKVIHIVSDEQEALKCFDEIRSQAPVPIVAPIGNIGGSHQIKVSAEPT
ncbi:MAG: LOG family protein, partial [Alphaproteobacteria bacterium]|nr:LOG family protein [Alphaproteobacteria bacterium]